MGSSTVPGTGTVHPSGARRFLNDPLDSNKMTKSDRAVMVCFLNPATYFARSRARFRLPTRQSGRIGKNNGIIFNYDIGGAVTLLIELSNGRIKCVPEKGRVIRGCEGVRNLIML